MTTQTQAATDITAVLKQIIAAHVSYPLVVEQENKDTVNQTLQTNPYLKVEIRFMAADQIELGAQNRLIQQWGQIWLSAVCKPGAGTADAKALLDFVMPYFDAKVVGAVQCLAVAAVPGKKVEGMWHQSAIVNFWIYRRS